MASIKTHWKRYSKRIVMQKLIQALIRLYPFRFRSDFIHAYQQHYEDEVYKYKCTGIIQEGIEKPLLIF